MNKPIFIKLVVILFLLALIYSSYPEYESYKEFSDIGIILISLVPILLLTQLVRFFHIQPRLQSRKSKIGTVIAYVVILIIGVGSFLVLMQTHNDNLDKYTLLFPYNPPEAQKIHQYSIVVCDSLSEEIRITRKNEQELLEWIASNLDGRRRAFNKNQLKDKEALIRKSFTWIAFVSFLIVAATLELFFFIKELGKFKEKNPVIDQQFIMINSQPFRIVAIQKSRSYASKANWKEVIKTLQDICQNTEERNQITQISSRFNMLESEKSSGQIDYKDYSTEINKISSSILTLIDQMEKAS